MSNYLIREHTDLQAEASALRQLATELVVELRIARTDAYGSDHAETADIFDLAASILDNRRAGQPLLEEIARLRAQLADLSRTIGEQHTTIGYQDAMIAQLRSALNEALRLALVPESNQDEDWYAAFDRIAEILETKKRGTRDTTAFDT